MLVLLMLAFGGSLALKAFEERQFADGAVLAQQAREAEALSGHVRAELVASRARMEGLLLAGASLEAIRRGVMFDAVTEREAPDGAWAQLAEDSGVRVFARSPGGHWISGLRPQDTVLPAPTDGRVFRLFPDGSLSLQARFESVDGQRSAVACAPVAGAGIAACVFRPSPLFGTGDLNRLIIYGLLLTAPLLAVFGLVGVIRRIEQDKAEVETKLAAAPEESMKEAWRSFEVPGVFGLWRWDPTMQLLTIGPEACALLGANHDGAMTLDEFCSVVNEDARRRVRDALEFPAGKQVGATFQGVGRAAERHFELMGGVGDSLFSGTILNVTDRVQAQLVSRRAEALARAALDAHPGPFALWDSRKRLTHWNASFARVFNLDKSVVQPGTSYDLVMAELAKFVRVERPLGDDANAREMLLLSDSWIRLVDRRTSSDGLITVGVDISTLKRQEAGLQRSERKLRAMVEELQRAKGQAQELAEKYAEAKARAERASHAKGAFLGNMSHELRTPLNGVIGALDLLARTSITSEQSSLLQSALSSGEALLYQINNVLDLSRMEAGCIDLEQAPYRPRELVSIVAKIMDPAARSNGNVITTVIADTLPEAVLGDVNRIRQILLNLVSNAIKFTRDGSIEIAIAVDLAVADAPMLVYSVTDTGYGIPANRIPELFEEFAMLDPSYARANAGSGLGLAICKRIATAMGGGMGVESEVGRGSRFWCRLPLNAADAPALAPAPETTSDLRRRLNVLLVDDGPTNRLIGAGLLKSMGHEVVTASSGEEAIALVSKQLFDVVFMDVSMPGMDGLTATRCIRKLEKPASTTPIIALTANALHGDRDRFLAAGMNEHVPKPYRLHDLEDGLRRVLSRDAGKAACAAVPAAAASALPAAPAAVRPGPA